MICCATLGLLAAFAAARRAVHRRLSVLAIRRLAGWALALGTVVLCVLVAQHVRYVVGRAQANERPVFEDILVQPICWNLAASEGGASPE